MDSQLLKAMATGTYDLLKGDSLYYLHEPPMLIESLLPKQTITGITSAPGVGKTWFAMELMRSLATGDKFLDSYPVTAEATCLFVGSDASIYDYARQWKKLTFLQWQDLMPDIDVEFSEDFDILHLEEQIGENPLETNIHFLLGSDFLFESDQTVAKLIKTSKDFSWRRNPITGEHEREGFSLIIFDTLSKLTQADQNDNSQMENVFRHIRTISEETGAGIVILHHNAYETQFRDRGNWRGASAQIAALDNWFDISINKQDKSSRDVVTKKFRGLTPNPFTYRMDIDEQKASLVAMVVEKPNKFADGVADSILEYLNLPIAEGKAFTVKQIANGLWNDYTELFGGQFEKFTVCVRNRLNFMLIEKNPKIYKMGGGKRSNRAEYGLVK